MNNMQPNTQGQQYAGASPGQVPQSRRMHPLVATAAVAVIIASLTAVAAITGVLPISKATQGSTDPNVAAQSSTATAASAPMALAAPGMAAPNQATPYPAQQNVAPAQPRSIIASRPMRNARPPRPPARATRKRSRAHRPARMPVR